jgi:hypothetical protein
MNVNPTIPTCSSCQYFQEFYPAADGEPGRGLCSYPPALLPLSMAGVACRERETVAENATGCPTYGVGIIVGYESA